MVLVTLIGGVITVNNPGWARSVMSAKVRFGVPAPKERLKMQIRADFFNVLNDPTFGAGAHFGLAQQLRHRQRCEQHASISPVGRQSDLLIGVV